jgi:spermidine/putrescine transport system substrate-binding protein
MSNKMSSTAATLIAAKAFSRRRLLKSALYTGAALSAAPLIGGRAFGQSSGEVNVYAWGEYISEDMIEAFKQDTGIQINLSVYGTNNEVLTKLTASQGEGFDIVFPSVTYLPAWYDAGDLLQPIDESKVDVDNIIPTLFEKSLELGATRRGKRYAIPFNWGTEAIAYDSTQRDYSYGTLSWDTQWEDENKGLVTTRPRSGLSTMAIMLDGTGEKFIEAHGDEEVAKQVFDAALKVAIARKEWIRQFWKDAQALTNAYMQNGCVVGQSWDGTAIKMWQDTDGKIKYLAPMEGALTWLDTMAIPSGAQNIDQTYALINWLVSAKGGGMHAVHSGYNSAAIGAEAALDEGAQDRFNFMYGNGAAIANLFWWPPEAGWFQKLRAQYIDQYEAA